MADITLKLSDAEAGLGVFHDWEYHEPESNRGANGDRETYKVTNKSGNCLTVIVKDSHGDEYTFDQSVEELSFTIHGAIESMDFANLMELITYGHVVRNALRGEPQDG
jgi:hypothetical protein